MRPFPAVVAILALVGCKDPGEKNCLGSPEAGTRPDAGTVADLLPGKPFGWVENDDGKGGKLVDITWTWENPLPQGNRLNEVWGTSLTDVYAVGDHGTILHFDGAAWKLEDSGTTADLYDVWGCGGSVFAVGASGTVLQKGKQQGWVKLPADTALRLNAVWCGSPDKLYVAGSDSYLAVFGNNTWAKPVVKSAYGQVGGKLTALWGWPATGEVWAAGEGAMLHHHNGGWELLEVQFGPLPQATAVWASKPGDIFITAGCGVFSWDGVGKYPKQILTSPQPDLRCGMSSVWGNSLTGAIFAVGEGGVVLERDATSAIKNEKLESSYLRAVRGVEDSFWAVGDEGGLFLRSSGGTWARMSKHPVEQDLVAVSAHESGLVVAAGRDGAIYRRYDGQWLEDWQIPGRTLTGIMATSASQYVVIDNRGTVYFREVTQDQTTTKPLDGQPEVSDIWAEGTDNVVVVGNLGRAFHFDGSKWRTRETGTAARLRGVWGTAANQLFAVGEDGSVQAFDGSEWVTVVPPDGYPLTGVWGTSAADAYAVGGQRILHFDGLKWQTVASGLPCGATAIAGEPGGRPQVATMCGDTFHLQDSVWVRVPGPTGTRLTDLVTLPAGSTFWVGNSATVLVTQEN